MNHYLSCFIDQEKRMMFRQLFDSIENGYVYHYRELNEVFSEVMDSYSRILKEFSRLASEFSLGDSLDVSIFFAYLLWNGYFSLNKELKYGFPDRRINFGYLGIEVMAGRGVCLDFSSLFKECLKSMGYDNELLVNRFKKMNYSKVYVPNIERHIDSSTESSCKRVGIFNAFASNYVIGNHVFNLISEHDRLFIYDPTNLMYIPLFKGKACFQDRDTKVVFYSLMSYFISNMLSVCDGGLFKRDSAILNRFFDGKESSFFHFNEYVFKCEWLLSRLRVSKDILDDYYLEIEKDISVVSDGVMSLKRKR